MRSADMSILALVLGFAPVRNNAFVRPHAAISIHNSSGRLGSGGHMCAVGAGVSSASRFVPAAFVVHSRGVLGLTVVRYVCFATCRS